MKKILVPVDFSESAANALRYALKLNRYFKAKIVLLYVFDMQIALNILPPEISENYCNYVKGFEDDLRTFLHNLNKGFEEYEYELKVLAGEDNKVIIRYADAEDVDLIILGNKGVGGLRKWFFGSVAQYVLTHSHVPVIAVPVTYTYEKISNVLLASDFMEEISDDQYEFLHHLAHTMNADFDMVHVHKNGDELFRDPKSESVFRFLQLQFNKNPHLLTVDKNGDVDLAIKHFMEENHAGLTVIIPHEHVMLDSLLSVNHTEKLMAVLECPLMTLPSVGRQRRAAV